MSHMSLRPVGYVETLSRDPQGESGRSTVRILPEYLPALEGVAQRSHLWILFWFHQLEKEGREILKAHPRKDKSKPQRGVFDLRSPVRPNPIGLTRVKLLEVRGDVLVVEGLDARPGTPVVDIKPATEERGHRAPEPGGEASESHSSG